jgi:putative sterol carrier protein
MDIDEEEYYRIGERGFNLQRAILLKEGHRPRRDDYLPREWHEEPLETHVADPECLVPGPQGKPVSMIGHRIDRRDYDELLEEFYLLRGWDVPTGLPSRSLLESLDMSDVADGLEASGLLVARPRGIPLGTRISRGMRRAGKGFTAALGGLGRFRLRGAGGGADGPGGLATVEGPSIRGEELSALLEEQRVKFADPKIAHNFRGWNKAMQYYFPDIDEYHVIVIEEGEAQPPEKLDEPMKNPEIHYEMSTQVLRAMTRGELSGFQAYQQRKLKLRAAFGDMMKLQALNKT